MASPLDELIPEDRDLTMRLLACIVDNGAVYQNRVVRRPDEIGTRYIVLSKENQSQGPESSQSYPSNITDLLVNAGLAVETPPPSPKVDKKHGLVIPRPSQGFVFTPLALNSYKNRFFLPPTEIQHRIGVELLENWHEYPDDPGVSPIDVSATCKSLGVTEVQFFRNIHILQSLGYVSTGQLMGGTLENGHIFLTEPKGLSWANAGSSPLGPDGSPIVNVTVNITLQHIIQEVEGLNISDEDKERIEILFHRFEVESKKDNPSFKPLQDLLSVAANVKELFPVLFKFGASHIDDIGRMVHHLPGI